MKPTILLFLFLWLSPNVMQAQVLDSVYKLLPDYPNDMHAMVVDDDTLVIVHGLYDTINEVWSINLLKMDTLGNILYSNLLIDSLGSHIRNLWGNKVIKTLDGGYAYAASYAHNPACPECIFLAKYKHSGEIDFVKYYQKPDTSYTFFAINHLLQLEDGGYFLFSFYHKAGGISVPHLIRTDAQGNELWSRDYPAGDTSVGFFDALVLNPNKFVVTGLKQKIIPVYTVVAFNPYLMVIDSLGNILYDQIGVDSLASINIVATDDGGFLQTIIKAKTFSNPFYSVVGIQKLDSNFVEEWVRYTDDIDYNDLMRYSDLIKTPDGHYVACGPRGLHGTANNTSMHIKISDAGEVIWERFDKAHWNGEEAYKNYPRAIGMLSSGSTVSVGSAYTNSDGELGWVFKISPGGCVYVDTIGCWPTQPDAIGEAALVGAIEVYPNPVGDELTVELPGDFHQKSYINFYDVTGRFLRKYSLKNVNHLSISDFPKGMIFYNIISQQGLLKTGKLVKGL